MAGWQLGEPVRLTSSTGKGLQAQKQPSDLQLMDWLCTPLPPNGLGLLPLQPRSCAFSVVTSISTSA